MTVEQELAAWASAADSGKVSREALDAAKNELIWTLGSVIAGSRDRGSDRVLGVCEALSGGALRGDCTIVGGGTGYTPDVAGFANGVFAKALEFEDKHWIGNSYAYAVAVAVVPAALAMAEYLQVESDAAILTAIAVATDVEMRLIDGAPNAIQTHFNSTYIFGHFGALVAAAKIANLSESEMLNALGLAYEQVAGTNQPRLEGSLGVRMQMGFCVRNGIYATLMAARDISGPHHFLGGKSGLYPAFFNEYREEDVGRGLGSTMLTTRLGYKGYPCCAAGHQGLDAVRSIRERYDFDPADIEQVVVHGAPSMAIVGAPAETKQRPTNHVEQSFSLPWAAACLLWDGRLELRHFREESLGTERYMALAGRVSTTFERAGLPVTAEITLTDGRTLTSLPVKAPRGHPDNPLSQQEIIQRTDDIVAESSWVVGEARTRIAKLAAAGGQGTDILGCLKCLF